MYRTDTRLFSNTLYSDYNSSPLGSKAWSASSSTVTDSETDNDAVLPAGDPPTGGPRTDYQADPNTNIYTKHGPYINKLTVYRCRL